MGCDIHMIVQRKHCDGLEEYWSTELPPAWWPRDEWSAEQIARYTSLLPDAAAAQQLAWYTRQWYDGRSYDLFGILADVRNTGWPSIAVDRGLPSGVTPNDREHDLGDHSFTWMTLREVLAYPWDTTTITDEGVVPLTAFLARDPEAIGFPYEEWCGGIWGPRCVTLSADEARRQLASGGIVTQGEQTEIYVRDTWPITARQACEWWCNTILPAFVRQADEWGVSHDDVRLVMGFDS